MVEEQIRLQAEAHQKAEEEKQNVVIRRITPNLLPLKKPSNEEEQKSEEVPPV